MNFFPRKPKIEILSVEEEVLVRKIAVLADGTPVEVVEKEFVEMVRRVK